MSVRYARCVDLLDDLYTGLADATYQRRLKRWAAPDRQWDRGKVSGSTSGRATKMSGSGVRDGRRHLRGARGRRAGLTGHACFEWAGRLRSPRVGARSPLRVRPTA